MFIPGLQLGNWSLQRGGDFLRSHSEVGAEAVSWFQPIPGWSHCPGPGLCESCSTSTGKMGEEMPGTLPTLSGPEFNLTSIQAATRVRPWLEERCICVLAGVRGPCRWRACLVLSEETKCP